MSRPTIISVGEVLWDLFPEGPRFGGAPANFACHAALQGGRVSILSGVGDDARGREAIAILQGFGIDTSLIQRIADAPTGTVGVKVDASGKPGFIIHEGSAWDRTVWTPELDSRIAEAEAIYFGTLAQRASQTRTTIRKALSAAKTHGIRRVLDVNLRRPFFDADLIRESITRASVLKLSEEELDEVAAACGIAMEGNPEPTLRALLERHELDLVAMTRGADGALLVSAEETIDQPGIPTIVCDTVGAGDAFTAALVVGLLRGDSLKTVARVACETAAAVCAQPGAVPAPPTPSKH
jgi:fructokinase